MSLKRKGKPSMQDDDPTPDNSKFIGTFKIRKSTLTAYAGPVPKDFGDWVLEKRMTWLAQMMEVFPDQYRPQSTPVHEDASICWVSSDITRA